MSDYGYDPRYFQEQEPDMPCAECGGNEDFCGCEYAHYEKHAREIIERVYAERVRQVQDKGYSPRHDNEHDNQELTDAAIAYAFGGLKLKTSDPTQPLEITCDWLTDEQIRRKPRIRQLEIAAALIVAEIERLERASKTRPLENASAVDYNSSRA